MHEQSSGGFGCFVSCRQRRKQGKVGKHEKAPLLISAIIDSALLTWSLFNPAETCQYTGNAACTAGSALAATALVLWPQESTASTPLAAGTAWELQRCQPVPVQLPAETQNPKLWAQKRQKTGKCPECNAQSSPVGRYEHSGVNKGQPGSAARLTNCVFVSIFCQGNEEHENYGSFTNFWSSLLLKIQLY